MDKAVLSADGGFADIGDGASLAVGGFGLVQRVLPLTAEQAAAKGMEKRTTAPGRSEGATAAVTTIDRSH